MLVTLPIVEPHWSKIMLYITLLSDLLCGIVSHSIFTLFSLILVWGWNTPVIWPDLQSRGVTENCIVYDGHRLWFSSFRLWFHPVGGYHVWYFALILEHIVFSSPASPNNEAHVEACNFVVLATTWTSGSVWSSIVLCIIPSFSALATYKVSKFKMPTVLVYSSFFVTNAMM